MLTNWERERSPIVRFGRLPLAVVLAFALTGCGTAVSPTQTATPAGTPALTASASPASAAPEGAVAADWARLEEIWRVVETLGPDVWDGWGEKRPPLLLQVGDADYLIGHPSPPEGFDPVTRFEVAGAPVLRRAGHLAPSIGVPPATASASRSCRASNYRRSSTGCSAPAW